MKKKSTVVKTDGSTELTVTELAKRCLERHQDRESDNIRRAEEAIRFRAGEQWPDAIKRDRENPNQDGGSRPCPVMDKTNQYVRQIVNEMRQNRAAIKIRPVDDKADKKVAEVYTGIIRHIEDASEALVAYSHAGEQAIDGGFGYFRIITEYCDPMSFDQDIRIKRIPNRFSVALGPHNEPDGADAMEGLIWEDMDKELFKTNFPKAKVESWNEDGSWVTEDTIRVAEYFRIEVEKQTIHLMPDGSTWDHDELMDAGAKESDAIKTRTTMVKKLKWYKIAGDDEPIEERDLPGSYIPIIKVIGSEIVMPDGKIRLSGMIEQAMDPQRLHNFASASFIENVALAPRAPWTAPKEAIAGFEDDYAESNRRNISILPYNHLDANGNPMPPPQRTQPAGISTGWQQLRQNTAQDIDSSIGMYGPSVGAKSQEKSGIALQEQKQQGMVGNFHYPDNLARSIQHGGRILLQWIPVYYDTERVARILGEDGTEEMAYLNPRQEMAVMPRMDKYNRKVGDTYNLNVGTYDLTVSTGPSYTSKRQEAAENQIQLIQAKPELMAIIGDIVFGNMDMPGADKISERLKAMLPPQIQQLEQKEGSEQDLQQQMMQHQAMAQQLEQQAHVLFQKEQELQQAQAAIQQAGGEAGQERAELEAIKKDIESSRKMLSSDLKIAKMQIELDTIKAKEIIEEQIEVEREQMGTEKSEVEGIVQTYDSQIAQPVAALAQSMESIAQIIAQSNQIAAQNSEALARMMESNNAHRQYVASMAERLLGNGNTQ